MELYFNRPRLRRGANTLLPGKKKRHDFMWFHDHDITSKLKVQHKNIIYLYRDPDQTIFSLLKAEHPKITDELVDKQIGLLKAHYKKYLLGKGAKVIVRYERFKKEGDVQLAEFAKFAKFMDPKKFTKINTKELMAALAKAKKEAIIRREPDRRYFNKRMLSEEYEKERKEFLGKYSSHIWDKLLIDELKDFFND
jgi:hypothetical protein